MEIVWLDPEVRKVAVGGGGKGEMMGVRRIVRIADGDNYLSLSQTIYGFARLNCFSVWALNRARREPNETLPGSDVKV